ncbi:winged helix-turn-helix domain-containing protein [Streptomyces sp. NPDC002133]|uniref:winged helix-turn-helix domain-containing protein n=1 Tax=Streptomyces sp. NPDC002133 TaxID=3154409 RepID=UPI0033320446
MIEPNGIPAYQQLAELIRRQVRTGVLAPGAALPSMSQLMKQYGVSNSVINSAMHILKSEGVVRGQQGKAVYVVGMSPDGAVGRTATPAYVQDLEHRMEQLGRRVEELERWRTGMADVLA